MLRSKRGISNKETFKIISIVCFVIIVLKLYRLNSLSPNSFTFLVNFSGKSEKEKEKGMALVRKGRNEY